MPQFHDPDPESSPRGNGNRRPVCSVIIPVFNERDNIAAMHEALSTMAASEPGLDWEFLFIDDGSTDDTYAHLIVANQRDERVKALRLSRNFGSHVGAAAGLRACSGDAAVIMAGDMQDHPREIPRFIEQWRKEFHVVWGVRGSRKDGPVNQILANLFSLLIRRVALPNYPRKGTGSFCLIDRKVIDALNLYPERNRMTFGLILNAGFRHTQIDYDRLERHAGSSKWSVGRKIKHSIDTIISFSYIPIRLTSMIGILLAMGSLVYGVYLLVGTLIYGNIVQGWTSIIVLVSMLGGVQLFVLGMLGEYLWRACDEVRGRPLFLVQDVLGNFPAGAPLSDRRKIIVPETMLQRP